MRKVARTILLLLALALGVATAHGTYVMTVEVTSYCAWDWGCWANPVAPNGQWRTEHLAIYDYQGNWHEHFSVYEGGCCDP